MLPRGAYALLLLACLALVHAPPPPPWRRDADAAREEARRAGRPCVLILGANANIH